MPVEIAPLASVAVPSPSNVIAPVPSIAPPSCTPVGHFESTLPSLGFWQ
jgi:hypothetical protein